MAPTQPGEPKQGEKPQPIGSFLFITLFLVCGLCIVYILWRRASSLKTVVSHQLKTWTGQEGRIRLSIDDGPPAREFLDDNDDDAHGAEDVGEDDDEPLAQRAARLASAKGLPAVVVTPPPHRADSPSA